MMKNEIIKIEPGTNYYLMIDKIMIKNKTKEYRNVKMYQHNKWSSKTYDADLWIDGKFIQHVTLYEVTYRYNVLMEKLKTLVDSDTLKEIDDVIDLKYNEGVLDGSDSIDR